MYTYEELYHHGVKGQKWGVRRYQNKDGTLTNAGKSRLASSVERTMAKNPGKTPGDMYDTLKRNPYIKRAHKALVDARKELDKTMEFKSNFYKNPKRIEMYQERAAKRIGEKRGYDNKQIKDLAWLMKYDDMDFGNFYSFEEYCRDNKVNSTSYENACTKAEIKYRDACKDYTKKLIGEYGDRIAYKGYSSNRSVTDIVANTLSIMGEEKYWYI